MKSLKNKSNLKDLSIGTYWQITVPIKIYDDIKNGTRYEVAYDKTKNSISWTVLQP